MTTLILIRHGESAANGKGFFAGQLDVPLSNRGQEQAHRVAEYIAKTYAVDAIYSSDLSRAHDTAKPLAEKLKLEIQGKKMLREIDSGDWQGVTFDVLQQTYRAEYGVWLKDIGNAVCPNGESVGQLYDRICGNVQKIANENDGKVIVIVTHATPIRALCCKAQGLPVEQMKDVPWVSNASLTIMQVDGEKFRLVKKDVCEYLSDLQTRFPANV